MTASAMDQPLISAIEEIARASAGDSMDLATMRAGSSRFLANMAPARSIAEVKELRIPARSGALKARLYRDGSGVIESHGQRPIVLFIHGGGWIAGSLEIVDSFCRSLAGLSGCIVVSIDYRLAPECPYPAGLEDCYDALTWVVSEQEALGSAGSIVVAGESAGGNLAAALCIYARDRKSPNIDHQLLIYPVTNDDCDTDSYDTYGGGEYLLTRDGMLYNWQCYLGGQVADGLAAPLKNSDLRRLPSATIFVCELDVLHDEGVAYARRLEADGVDVSLHELSSLPHAALAFDGVSLPARAMVHEVARSMRDLG